MGKKDTTAILWLVCAILSVAGCKCNDCKDLKPGLLGEYEFGGVGFIASGYGHCTDLHTIVVAEGPTPCKLAVVGLDGWGPTNNGISSVKAEINTGAANPSFSIAPGQVIDSKGANGCSDWTYLTVSGSAERSANLLLMTLTFADTATGYNSGPMQYTYVAQ